LHFQNREGFKKTAKEISQVEFSAAGLRREFEQSNVVAGIVMTTAGREAHQTSQYNVDLTLEDGGLDCLFSCVGVNPVLLQEDDRELQYIEDELQKTRTVGIKIYPGYFPYYVYDPIYDPVYELAKKYDVPVVIHCGDTSSPRGLLKYSHPLTIDELAVNYQDVTFVVCHLGDPWVMDTAELISKNPNVYTDVSGLIAGNAYYVYQRKNTVLYSQHIQRAFVYADRYDKIMFGTDWPLVPIGPYIEFIKSIVPETAQEEVFFHNALTVFPRMKALLKL